MFLLSSYILTSFLFLCDVQAKKSSAVTAKSSSPASKALKPKSLTVVTDPNADTVPLLSTPSPLASPSPTPTPPQPVTVAPKLTNQKKPVKKTKPKAAVKLEMPESAVSDETNEGEIIIDYPTKITNQVAAVKTNKPINSSNPFLNDLSASSGSLNDTPPAVPVRSSSIQPKPAPTNPFLNDVLGNSDETAPAKAITSSKNPFVAGIVPNKPAEPEVKILNTDAPKATTTVVKIPKKKAKTPSGSQVSDSLDMRSTPAKDLPVIGVSVRGFDIRKSGSNIASINKGSTHPLNVNIPVTSGNSPQSSPVKANPKPTSPRSPAANALQGSAPTPTAKAVLSAGTSPAARPKNNLGGASQHVSASTPEASDNVTTGTNGAHGQKSPDTLIVSASPVCIHCTPCMVVGQNALVFATV